jgi:hypothetical protein
MRPDPLVAEVRAVREAYAEQFGYDIEALCRDLKAQEKKGGRRLVSFPPRKSQVTALPK